MATHIRSPYARDFVFLHFTRKLWSRSETLMMTAIRMIQSISRIRYANRVILPA